MFKSKSENYDLDNKDVSPEILRSRKSKLHKKANNNPSFKKQTKKNEECFRGILSSSFVIILEFYQYFKI